MVWYLVLGVVDRPVCPALRFGFGRTRFWVGGLGCQGLAGSVESGVQLLEAVCWARVHAMIQSRMNSMFEREGP